MIHSMSARILYMEDDRGLARLFQKRLERSGYRVDVAQDGNQGLSMCDKTPYDVLVVDHKMPGQSGIEVIRVLAEQEKLPVTIMVTGAGDETVAVEAMKLGASDYVIKDVDGRYLDLMKSVIEQALSKQRLIQEREEARIALQRAHDELERRVRERTLELAQTNEQLRREITERIRAEDDLRTSEERFRAIFESARDCIFIKDKSLRYSHVNPYMAALLERDASAIVGRSDAEIFDRDAGDHLREVENRVLAGEIIEEEHARPVKGSPITFLDTRVPMRNARGDVVGIFGISRNITERKMIGTLTKFVDEQFPSLAMRTTLSAAQMAAQTNSIILLTGESGAGKDYLARYIHDHSPRASNPFYAINCAAVAPELAESELFGHEAGAFTGATRRKRGLLELAEGGTLLLNEIGELSQPLQAKLLTFLDSKAFTRVGGEKSVTVNARLIAATNRDLENEVHAGRFRADLFYRLNVFSIRVPPLRERVEDIPLLVRRMIGQLGKEMQLPVPPEIDLRVLTQLSTYHWPGNVRELRNVLERALILSGNGLLDPTHIPVPDSDFCGPRDAAELNVPAGGSFNDTVRDVKRKLIEEALTRAGGKRQDAARLLGISRHALKRQMKTLGFYDEDDPDL
ncbi:MAG: sigma 54-interacting transcriptional regulator [Thermodesulfobacteriota bacterium]